MRRDAGCELSERFAARARDLTPPALSGLCRVLYAATSNEPDLSELCAAVLSDSERARATRFLAESDRRNFVQRRAFRRFCAAQVPGAGTNLSGLTFDATAKGRPVLAAAPDIWFSFSSCHSGLLGAWSATHAIGVDIEDPTKHPDAGDLANHYFSTAESRALQELDGAEKMWAFARLWCLKEAALKSIGEGLPFGLDAFCFGLTPTPRLVRAPPDSDPCERYMPSLLTVDDLCVGVVLCDRSHHSGVAAGVRSGS